MFDYGIKRRIELKLEAFGFFQMLDATFDSFVEIRGSRTITLISHDLVINQMTKCVDYCDM